MVLSLKVISLNVSKIREVPYDGKMIKTGIFKEPVKESLEAKGINIEGDDQGNRKTHGGIDRAIYSYPMEHYSYWKKQYPDKELPFGMFGENLTTEGLIEKDVKVGDIFRIGTVEMMAMQPRMPCYRLGFKFDDQKVIDKFLETDFCGIFYRIIKEGKLQVGDEINLIKSDPDSMTMVEIFYLMQEKTTEDLILRALKLEHLPDVLNERFQKLLETRRTNNP